jgi:3-deoxy-D-manno-octulosonic-acid transferase
VLLVDLAYLLALLLVLPFLLWKVAWPRGRRHVHGLRERLGRCERRDGDAPCIWIHGVSVGEIRAAAPLVAALEEELPGFELVLSTGTSTGQAIAKSTYPNHRVFYYPIDFSWAVRSVVEAIRPDLVILVELELWPNFLREAYRRDTPVAIVNGRITQRSYRGYRWVRWLLFAPLGKIGRFCVQTERYAERFRKLGIPEKQIHVTGSMKYDQLESQEVDVPAVRRDMGLGEGEIVLLGGSTHPGEEKALVEAFLVLREQVPTLRLVICPRHTERSGEVERHLADIAPGVQRRSKRQAEGRTDPLPHGHVLVVDTIGELGRLYGAADVCFVGGSLIPHGGQNVLEPVTFGKPTVFGPYWDNFKEPVERLLAVEGVREVADADDLTKVLSELLEQRENAAAMGERGRQAILEARGATARTVKILRDLMAERGLIGSGAPE